MRHLLALAAAALLSAAAQAQDAGQSWAEAKAGRLLCMGPDAARKTCNTMLGLDFLPDGVVRHRAQITMSAAPHMVLLTTYDGELRGDSLCARTPVGAVDEAEFLIDGAPMSAKETERLRGELAASMAGPVEELCMWEETVDGRLRTGVSIDGVHDPRRGEDILWIDADEGYEVKP